MGDENEWRRIGAGLCLIGGPLLIVAGDWFRVGMGLSDALVDQLVEVRGGIDRWYVGTALSLIGLTLLIGAVLAVVHLCHRSGAESVGLAGGALAVIGVASILVIVAFELLLVVMAQSGQDSIAMEDLADAVDSSARVSVVYVVSLLFFVGWLVLAYGLHTAGTVDRWVPPVLGLAIVVLAVGLLGSVEVLLLVAGLLLLASLGQLGVRALQGRQPWGRAAGL